MWWAARARLVLVLVAVVGGANAHPGHRTNETASSRSCTRGQAVRFLGHTAKAWIGNDADSYFPIFSHVPVFVNGTDENFTQACLDMCRSMPSCGRWSFWRARRDIGGVCFVFAANAQAAPSDPDWEGGSCEGSDMPSVEGRDDDAMQVQSWRESWRKFWPLAFVLGSVAILTSAGGLLALLCSRKKRARTTTARKLQSQTSFNQAWDAELGRKVPSGNVDPLARLPTHWGMTVEQLELFHAIHHERLQSYCREHRLAADKTHVCMEPACRHKHGAAKYRALNDSDSLTDLDELHPTMHVVVDLIIKPFTDIDGGVLGYAPLLNKANPLKPTVFVSHCWGEKFPDFVRTVTNHLPRDTVVWICSFALPQNLDINLLIGQGELCESPFHQALLQASRLFLVLDERLLPLDRVWCLYEMYICTMNKIRIDVRAPTMSKGLFRSILQKIEVMDIRQCSAASISDRERIMGAVRGSEEKLNSEVRQSIEELVRLMESIKD